jgi:hypothetical protein
MPGDDIERGVSLSAAEQSTEALVDDLPTTIRIDIKGRYRMLEVADVGETISA